MRKVQLSTRPLIVKFGGGCERKVLSSEARNEREITSTFPGNGEVPSIRCQTWKYWTGLGSGTMARRTASKRFDMLRVSSQTSPNVRSQKLKNRNRNREGGHGTYSCQSEIRIIQIDVCKREIFEPSQIERKSRVCLLVENS